MKKTILLIALSLAILVAILVYQNRAPVETHIFFATVVMSHAILLFLTALAGFILGVIVALLAGKRESKNTREKQTTREDSHDNSTLELNIRYFACGEKQILCKPLEISRPWSSEAESPLRSKIPAIKRRAGIIQTKRQDHKHP